MPPPCSVCGHPHRKAIEAALGAGRSYRDTARQYQIGKSSLVRHRQHGARHRVSTERREALRRQIEALQPQAQAARNIVTLGQVVQKMARLLGQLCEHDE